MSNQSFRNLLESEHAFPGEYVFRVIGANRHDQPQLQQSIERRLIDAGISIYRFECRESRAGSYTAYHVVAMVESAEQVEGLAEGFQRIDGVRLVL